MKNKKVYIVILIVSVVVFLVCNIKEEKRFIFKNHAKTLIVKKSLNFGHKKLGEVVSGNFIIKNVSNETFIIAKILCKEDESIVFNNNFANKVVLPDQVKVINVEFLTKERGKIVRIIEVVSNSTSGIIKLELKGIVE
jgi:hypothetical protein